MTRRIFMGSQRPDQRRLHCMRLICFLLFAFFLTSEAQAKSWQDQLDEELPLLGHRNWILIVDSAYPLQVSPGIETIETNADQLSVLKAVLQRFTSMKHVRPIIFEDQELSFVPEGDAPGVTRYRSELKALLGTQPVQLLPHEQIIGKVDEVGKTFRVLVLKTTLTIPYTSVFLQLDCKYWGSDAESKLRKTMSQLKK